MCSRRRISEITELVEHSGSDGVVLVPPLTENMQLLAHLDKHRIPFASISPRSHEGRIGVMVDEPAAVRDLMAHLIKLGHRRIGHIKGHPDHGACAWRYAGYRAALKAAGNRLRSALVVDGEFTFESGVNGARRLLDLKDPPTAIFAANDDMAAGVLRVAGERGIRFRATCRCAASMTRRSHGTSIRPCPRCGSRLATWVAPRPWNCWTTSAIPGAGRMVPMPYTLQLRESIAPPPVTMVARQDKRSRVRS